MARIVCQVLHRSRRISLLWSEGAAYFEPYHLEGAERDKFLGLARQIHERLAAGGTGVEFAQQGRQLYRALFRLDAGDDAAHAVHSWFVALTGVESLEFLCDEPGQIPWNVLIDEVPAAESLKPGGDGWQRFFGARFNLGVGRRVNAMRQIPFLEATPQLFAADPQLAGQAAEALQALTSTASLAAELRNTLPEIVLVLVRFADGRLHLGADGFTINDLQTWVRDGRDDGLDPLVILLGAGAGAEQAAWQTLLKDASSLLPGLLANESLLPAGPLVKFATTLVQRFALGHKSLGEELRALRLESGAPGLAFSAFCPPQVHVVTENAELTQPESVSLPLPRLPYRSFAAYDGSDRPLFVGRQNEMLTCASLVDQALAQGVVLHGDPAGGKTSFLQAGLLPCLEDDSVGYRVLRDRTALDTPVAETDYPILILRCTDDLTGQLADALSVFCAQPYIYTTPLGTQVTVDLPGRLRQAIAAKSPTSTDIQAPAPATDFAAESDDGSQDGDGLSAHDLWIALQGNKELLAATLDDITQSLPFELVIAVDQGEELFTLVETPAQQERRRDALDMLLTLASSPARCKLIFVLRSHYVGQLVSLLPQARFPDGWLTFFLPMLSESKMLDALLWPTSREEIPYSAEIPFQKYGFSYEQGMARTIVAEANEAAAADQQSPLPILQAVGAVLYELQVQQRQQNILRPADLKALGGVNGALMKALDRALERLPVIHATRQALRDLIGKLGTTHTDGAVTRDLVPAGDLKSYWSRSPEPVEQVVNTAAESQGLFEIQQLLIGGRRDVFVSLPQDSLAQLGRKLDAQREQKALARTKVIDVYWIMIPLAFCLTVLSWFITKNYVVLAEEERIKLEYRNKFNEYVESDQEKYKELQDALYFGEMAKAQQSLLAGNAQLASRRLLQYAPPPEPEGEERKFRDMRGFEWHYLWKYLHTERHLLAAHDGAVLSVAISPDSRRAATTGTDGTIRLWSLTDGQKLALLGDPGGKLPVYAVAFSPDGKTLASAGADKTVRLWDLGQLKQAYVEIPRESKALAGHTEAIHALAFSRDPNTLASGGADKSVIVWDLAQGKPKHTLKEHAAGIEALAFGSDGATLVSAGADPQLLVWEAVTGKKRQAIKTPYRSIAALAFSPDGKTLATGGVDTRFAVDQGRIRFWDLAAAKEMSPPLHHSLGVFALAYAPDGKSIASAGKDDIVRLWDVATAKQSQRWLGHTKWVRALAFASDGASLLSGSLDKTAKVWNPAQSSGPEVIAADTDWVQSLALGRNNALLASGSSAGRIKIWDTATNKLLLTLPPAKDAPFKGAITSLAFSSHLDRSLLAAGSRDEKGDGELRLWKIDYDPARGCSASPLPSLKGHRQGITALAFNPTPDKADLLLSGSVDSAVILWNAEKGQEKQAYRSHKEEVRAVAFSPEGSAFASGGKDRQVFIYEIDKKDAVPFADAPGSVESIAMWHMLGKEDVTLPALALGCGDNSVRLWIYVTDSRGQVGQKKEVRVFKSHVQPVTGVVYSAKENGLFVSSSWDGTVKLYDAQSERFTFLGHSAPVRAIALASDLSFLASAANDGTIRIWRATPDRKIPRPEEK